MRAKSSGVAPGLANARPQSCTKFANDPPRADRAGQMPSQLPERGAWAHLEFN